MTASGPSPAQRARQLALALLLPFVLLGLIHTLSQVFSTATPAQVLRLDQARHVLDEGVMPPQGEAAQAVELPMSADADELAQASWFLLDFSLAQPAGEPYLLRLQHRPGLSVFLNGQLLAHSGVGDELEQTQRGLLLGSHDVLVNVPPALLPAGVHRLALRLAAPGFEGATLSEVYVGPSSRMTRLHELRRFWQSARALTIFAGVVLGLFMLMLWGALRQEWLNGVTGVYCLSAALLLSPYLFTSPPLPSPWWRMLLDAADIVSKALMLFLTARLLGWKRRWPDRLALGFAALALPIDLLAAYHSLAWTDFQHPWPWWALCSRAVMLLCAWAMAAYAAWRRARWVNGMGGAALGLAALAWAYVGYFALIEPHRFKVMDVNVAGYAALIGMAAWVLQRRFSFSLLAQERARVELEAALAQRTAELEARYRDLQQSEQLRMAAQERERLLQEMHDGLGSQLLMARLGVAQGMDAQAMSATLDACIDEMRLSVDALSVDDGDLALLLANVRHRLGPRLQAAGLQLDWQLADTPLLPCLMGAQGRELVRIVQEALSNVLHHAQATRVRIATSVQASLGCVQLRIEDDGHGMPARPDEGQGLRNMRKRAERLGARIEWRAGEDGGTVLALCLPLGAEALPQGSGLSGA